MKLYLKYLRPYTKQFKAVCPDCHKVVKVTLRDVVPPEDGTVITNFDPTLVAAKHSTYAAQVEGGSLICEGAGKEVDEVVNIPCWICRVFKQCDNVPKSGPARDHLVCCKHYRMYYR
jgi:hypothetical protein